MSQNTSSAVMQQRKEPHDSLDYFPTPPWATRALCERLERDGPMLQNFSVWEPACAEGHMARPLGEYFGSVLPSDVHDYGYGAVLDFLIPMQLEHRRDWIITNPPFRLAEQFIARADDLAPSYAMLVRVAFLEGVGRHRDLFSKNPPTRILQFTERVPMFKGRLDRTGSTATAYCWLVWERDLPGHTSFEWIAPCRKRLERPEDYE